MNTTTSTAPCTETVDLTMYLRQVTGWLSGRVIGNALTHELNKAFPPGGPVFETIAHEVSTAISEGRLGKAIDDHTTFAHLSGPCPDTAEFSIDAVKLTNVIGSRHMHPRGEINMIMPLDAEARFNGHNRGWLVLAPDTAHAPTVTGGTAIILYLLPEGKMEF